MLGLNRLRGSVAVITGASSGIGRATAHEFARRGATVVLAARRREALERTLEECERLGGRGIVVPTDVSDREQVDRLAATAVEHCDRLDVWVNNAAVSLFGRLEETPPDAYEQVLKTNLLGYVNGSRAAIRQFRSQGAGKLINVASMVAHAGQPLVSAYVTSKWAIRGLTECLRMELADAPNISATTISPASIDTPIFQHAGNYFGKPAKAMKPVYPPEQVAAAIVRAARRPRREVAVGNAGRALALLRTLAPPLGERLMRRQVEKDHFSDGPPVELGPGNLFESTQGPWSVHGGWMDREHSDGRRADAAMAATLLIAVPLAVLASRSASRVASRLASRLASRIPQRRSA